MSERLLSIRNLKTFFFTHAGEVKTVRGINFDMNRGEVLSIVGESGSSKSVASLSIMSLFQHPGRVMDGEIFFQDQDILSYGKHRTRRVRSKGIAMIFQDPMTSLNSVYTVGNQIMGMLQEHEDIGKGEAKQRAIEMLRMVDIPLPEEQIHNYPHEFSGGMHQRAITAIALVYSPKLLIADEPTTTLDMTVQARVFNLTKHLNQELDMATILIAHDLGMVATLYDKMVVIYGRLIVEDDTVEEIFYHPKHPYTMGLIDSIPRVTDGEKQRFKPIPGTPPNLIHPPKGCPFSTRCPYRMSMCMEEMPLYFQEDGHRTTCWLLCEETPVNPEYVQRKEAMRRTDG